MNPYPMAFTERAGKPLRVITSRLSDRSGDDGGIAGEVVAIDDDEGVLVRTGNGCLAITEIQPEGKSRMTAQDYARGYRLMQGDKFGSDPAP